MCTDKFHADVTTIAYTELIYLLHLLPYIIG